MSVNWNWSDKKGEIVWKAKPNTNLEKEYNLKWSIYHANCICCFIKENDEDNTYEFMSYFSDVHHMKRMLGLERYKGFGNKYYQNDWFKEIYCNFEIDYIRLDVNYPYNDKIAKYFAQAGYEVRLYKGEVKKND